MLLTSIKFHQPWSNKGRMIQGIQSQKRTTQKRLDRSRACPICGLWRACRVQSQIRMHAICVYAMNVYVTRYKIRVLLWQTKNTKVSMCIKMVENLKLIPPTNLTTSPCVRCKALGSVADPMVSIPYRQLATSLKFSSKPKPSHCPILLCIWGKVAHLKNFTLDLRQVSGKRATQTI